MKAGPCRTARSSTRCSGKTHNSRDTARCRIWAKACGLAGVKPLTLAERRQTRVRYNPQAGNEDRLFEVVEGAGFSVLADALAGAVFGLARLRDVWAQYGVRPFEAALALVRMLRDGRPEEEEAA